MDAVSRRLAPLARRLRNLVVRATVTLVDDAPTMQSLQVAATTEETLDACEHWQGYGLTVHPHPGAEALLLAAGGTRAMPLIIACADRRYRLTGLEQGEVALQDDQGQTIVLRRSGIEITAPQGLTITGDVTLTGNLTQTGDTTQTGNLTQTGDLTQTGNVNVTGSVAATTTVTAGAESLTALAATFAAHKHWVFTTSAKTGLPLT